MFFLSFFQFLCYNVFILIIAEGDTSMDIATGLIVLVFIVDLVAYSWCVCSARADEESDRQFLEFLEQQRRQN